MRHKILVCYFSSLLLLASFCLLILALPLRHREPVEWPTPRPGSAPARLLRFENSPSAYGSLGRSSIAPATRQAKSGSGPRRSKSTRASVTQVADGGEERLLSTARQALEEASQLRAEWKESSLRQAIEKYQLAWRNFEAAGQRRNQAEALKKLGEVFSLLGDTHEALAHFDQALSLTRAEGDPRQEVELLNDKGGVYALVGENQKAITVFQQALRLGKKIDDRPGVAHATGNLGAAFYNLSDMNRALDLLKQALQLWETVDDPGGRAQTLRYLGYLYTDLSELPLALDYLQQSLPLWRAAHDLPGEAQTVTTIGLIHSLLGEREQAIECYSRAEQSFRTVGDRHGIVTALNGQGDLYTELNLGRALDCHAEALRLSEETGELDGRSVSHRYLGKIHRALGDAARATGQDEQARQHYEQAIEHYQQSLMLSRILADRRIEAYNLQDLGGVYDFLGDATRALNYYQQALRMSRAVKDRRGQALVLNNIGEVYARSEQRQQALVSFNQALPLTRATQDHAGESLTLYNIARLQGDQGALSAAVTNIEAAISIIESLRTKVPGHTFRSSYFASVHSYYELRINLLMQRNQQNPAAGFDVLALEDSELARARSLLDMLAEAHAEIRSAVAPELVQEERSVRQTLNVKAEYQMNLLSRQHSEEQAAAAEREIRELTARYDNVEARIRSQSPHYAALTQPQPLSLRQIQQRVLDDDSLLLEYALGDDRSYLWAVSRAEIASFELPGRKEIEETARRFYKLLTAHQPLPGETFEQLMTRAVQADEQLLHESSLLGRLILGPVAAKLKNKRLLIVADGALQYIPFQALVVPQTGERDGETPRADGTIGVAAEPLIVKHEIVNQPSASALARLMDETEGRQPASNTVAVIADPVFESDDPRIQSNSAPQIQAARRSGTVELEQVLRDVGISSGWTKIPRLLASRVEAEAIMSAAPWGTGFKATDFEANRATATSPDLNNYRIVHFATHSLLNNEHPELSGIVLSLFDQRGQPQDGFLRMHDIYNLNLPVDLVVLSACNTGLGKDVRGEGLVGLTRGFMYAGAAGVVASLWKVDDEATAELMRHFYEAMFKEGLSPSAALRKAQLELSRQKRWHSPYYWAGFVIQGQYAQRESRDRRRIPLERKLVAGVTVMTILLITAFYAIRHRRRRTF